MLERHWLWITALLLGGGLALKQAPLLLAASLFFLTMGSANVWNHFSLTRLAYHRRLGEEKIFCGETVSLDIRIANRKLLPLPWVRVEDVFPADLTLLQGDLEESTTPKQKLLTNLFSLGPYHAVTRRYRVHCSRRGIYQFGPATLHSGDLFGIFKRAASVEPVQRLIVYPPILPLDSLSIPADQLFGEIRVRRHLYQDPAYPVSVRQYRPGDSPRHINWKATARLQELQTKVYDHNITLQLSLFLDVRTVERPYRGLNPELMEQSAAVAASLAHAALQRGYAVSLAANEMIASYAGFALIKVPSGTHRGQLRAVLEALAAVRSVEALPIEKLIRSELKRLPSGASLVVIAAAAAQPLLDLLVRLKRSGQKVILIVIGGDASSVPSARGLQVLRLPADLPGNPAREAPGWC